MPEWAGGFDNYPRSVDLPEPRKAASLDDLAGSVGAMRGAADDTINGVAREIASLVPPEQRAVLGACFLLVARALAESESMDSVAVLGFAGVELLERSRTAEVRR